MGSGGVRALVVAIPPVPPAAPPVAPLPAAMQLVAVPCVPDRVFGALEHLDLYVVLRVVYSRSGEKSLALFVPGMYPGVEVASGHAVSASGVVLSVKVAQESAFYLF